MILTIFIPWRNTSHTVSRLKEYTTLGNVIKKLKLRYIAPRDLINTRNFISVVGSPGIFQRWGIPSWKINIACPIVQIICVVDSPPYLTLPVELGFCACSITVTFITTCYNLYVCSSLHLEHVLFILNVLIHVMTDMSYS